MSHLDPATRERLERLRESDVSGIFASDEPSLGSDPDGAMTVTVDPTNRVQDVRVTRVDRLRSPERLAAAFEAADSSAIRSRIAVGEPAPADRPRPVAKSLRLEVRPATPEILNRHQIREQDRGRSPVGRIGPVIGVSANTCVSVTLFAGGARGEIDVEAGWLQNTTASNLSAAITQAFADAYSGRDER